MPNPQVIKGRDWREKKMQQIDIGHFDSSQEKKIIGSVNKIVKEVYDVDQELVELNANIFELK